MRAINKFFGRGQRPAHESARASPLAQRYFLV